MAQPYPPQGNQQPHTERPLKIYAEQYVANAPIPIGVLTTAPTGEPMNPYVLVGGVFYYVVETNWVISNRYTGAVREVISAEEFAERFGPSE